MFLKSLKINVKILQQLRLFTVTYDEKIGISFSDKQLKYGFTLLAVTFSRAWISSK